MPSYHGHMRFFSRALAFWKNTNYNIIHKQTVYAISNDEDMNVLQWFTREGSLLAASFLSGAIRLPPLNFSCENLSTWGVEADGCRRYRFLSAIHATVLNGMRVEPRVSWISSSSLYCNDTGAGFFVF